MKDQLEQELAEALARIPAPEGFADRVLARLPEEHARLRWRYAYVAAAAVLIMALFLGGLQITRQRRQQQARETERQVVFAFALAAEKLQHINSKLENSGPQVKLDKKQEKTYE